MSVCLDYPDTITLVIAVPSIDGYATNIISEEAEVPAIFNQNTGWTHTNHQNNITSDAIAFIDPTNDFVADNFYRLEEMYVIANPFGASESQSWYKVESVTISQDSQLCNEIDNIQLGLKKTRPLSNVS